MTGCCEARSYSCKWPLKIRDVVTNQSVGKRCVLCLVAIARDQEVIRKGAGNALRPRYERLPMPLHESLIPSAHALSAPARQ
jgi:hypothetical protein